MRNKCISRFLFFLISAWMITSSFSLRAQDHEHLFDSLVKAQSVLPDDTNKIKTMIQLCREATYFHSDTAIVWASKGLKLAEKLNDDRGRAGFYSVLSAAYMGLADYVSATKYCILSLDLYEKLGDKKNLARVTMNLGNIYYFDGKFELALQKHQEAMNLYDELGNKKGVADCAMNMGNDYSDLGQWENAASNYKKSLDLRLEIGDKKGQAQALNNLGDLAMAQKQFDLARKYFTDALDIKTSLKDTFGMSTTMLGLGNLEVESGNYAKGIEWAKRSEYASYASGNNRTRRSVYELLALANEKAGDYKQAYYYYQRYFSLHDSLYNEEKNRNIEEMQTRYETEKKQKENEVLKQQSVIQSLESERKDQEIRNQRIVIFSAVALAVILLMLALVIFRNYRQKQRANEIISKQKLEVEHQKGIIEEKQKEILDSITYARRIQRALLASDQLLERNIPDHFVLYKPKDIVSGDFYWAAEAEGKFMYLTGDCTGHGVPGAFMSLLNITLLNSIISENRGSRPDAVLNKVREQIITALNPEGGNFNSWDGMDAVLCQIDRKERKLYFACSNNPLWIIRNGELLEFAPDKQPVGYFAGDMRPFTLRSVDLEQHDMIYTFTDGYADQFGGSKGKKFKYSQLKSLLTEISALTPEDQKVRLNETFDSWRGDMEQVDDVLIIGVKV